ncbi:MAG TPA: YbdD/YjiX family protein [Gemmatimonadaceae bacterium]
MTQFSRFVVIMRRVGALARRVIGAPDYEGYLSHVRVHHPHTVPLTRGEFARDALARRYERPGSRCC